MNRYARFALFLSLSLGVFSFIQPVFAEVEPAEATKLCPDFGEETVRVVASVPSSKVAAGALLPVKVSLVNVTDRPLSGGALLVKLVLRTPEDGRLSGAAGTVVSRTLAFEGMSLPARKLVEREFHLSVSNAVPRGSYDLQVIYALSEEFNLENPDSDLALRMGVNMAVRSLSIENENETTFAFLDSKSARVEGEGSDARMSVDVVNAGPAAVAVPVLWKAYAWNSLSEKSVVESRVEVVSVPAKSKKTISYKVSDGAYGMYQVVAQADSKGARSIASLPLEKAGGGAVIKLAGIAPFPADDGFAWAYACVHNIYSDDEESRTISLSLSDASGRVVGKGTFPVPFGLNDFQVAKTVPVRGDVTLLASVASAGEVKQSVSRSFKCEEFGGCAPSGSADSRTAAVFALTLLAAGIGGLVTVRYYLKHMKTKKPDASSNNPSQA